MKYDYLIVGAGLFGSVLAERIANDLGKKVLIIDKRSHIGGNCYSEVDEETGIEVHQYGTHIFHTSSVKAWNYINRFTEFNGYYHQVLSTYKDKVYQMPINLETINTFYDKNLKPLEAKEFIAEEIAKEGIIQPQNLEEKAISLIGRPLYEAFIKGYTVKQWGKDPVDLPADIITRLPVRYNYREDYFTNSRWQGIPLDGYTKVFERILESKNIHIELNCDYFENIGRFDVRNKTIFSGPIDKYFDYKYGALEWRTVDLEREVVGLEDFQGTSVMNYAGVDVAYTRIHEPKHLHPERSFQKEKTVIFYESSRQDSSDPYYPLNTASDRELCRQYRALAAKEKNVIFGGRLGDYAYYDMDKTIDAALSCYEENVL